jgi:type II secretory pathway component PulF
MTISTSILGTGCLILALLLTFLLPIQRGRFQNQLWDFITLALFVAGTWFIRYWDDLSNLGLGVIAGIVAILIRDFRLWTVRFQDRVYRRGHRYHWYGRARDWYGRRRRY